MKKVINFSILGAICLIAFIFYLGRSPDLDLYYERTIPCRLNLGDLNRSLGQISEWQKWNYHLLEAKPVEKSSSELKSGDLIELTFKDRRIPWKRIHWKIKVIQFKPQSVLEVQLLEDSSLKITKLFEDFSWKIEISRAEHLEKTPEGQTAPTQIKVSLRAKTHAMRARFYGRLSKTAILNQALPVDLEALAGEKSLDTLKVVPEM